MIHKLLYQGEIKPKVVIYDWLNKYFLIEARHRYPPMKEIEFKTNVSSSALRFIHSRELAITKKLQIRISRIIDLYPEPEYIRSKADWLKSKPQIEEIELNKCRGELARAIAETPSTHPDIKRFHDGIIHLCEVGWVPEFNLVTLRKYMPRLLGVNCPI